MFLFYFYRPYQCVWVGVGDFENYIFHQNEFTYSFSWTAICELINVLSLNHPFTHLWFLFAGILFPWSLRWAENLSSTSPYRISGLDKSRSHYSPTRTAKVGKTDIPRPAEDPKHPESLSRGWVSGYKPLWKTLFGSIHATWGSQEFHACSSKDKP